MHSGKPELRHRQQNFLPQTSLVLSAIGSLELRMVSSAILEHTNNNTSHSWLGLVIVSYDRRTREHRLKWTSIFQDNRMDDEKLHYAEVLSAFFIPTLDTTTKFVIMIIFDWLETFAEEVIIDHKLCKAYLVLQETYVLDIWGDSNKYPKHMFYEGRRLKQDISYVSFCSLSILYSKFISLSPDSIFSVIFSFLFKGIQSSIAYNDLISYDP